MTGSQLRDMLVRRCSYLKTGQTIRKSSVDLSITKQLKSKTDQLHTKTLESCCCCLFVLNFLSKVFLLLLNLGSIHSSNKNKRN